MKKAIILLTTFFLFDALAWPMAQRKDDTSSSSMFVGGYHQTFDHQTRVTVGTSIPIASHLYALTYADVGGRGGSGNAEFVYYFTPVPKSKFHMGILAGPNFYYEEPTFDITAATGVIGVYDINDDFGVWTAWKANIGEEAELDKWSHIIGGGLYFYLR